MKIKVPPIKIQGIKTKLVPFIKQSIQWNDKSGIYYEPFMGSGVVGFNLNPPYAFFSDTNPAIINVYRQLQTGQITPQLVRKYLTKEGHQLAQTPKNRQSYYYTVRNRFNKYHHPLDFLFLQRANFNGMIRFGPHGYNVPFGRKPNRFRPALITKIVNQVKWVQNLIQSHHQNWQFKVAPWQRILKHVQPNDFIYLDPPYVARNAQYFNAWTSSDALKLNHFLLNHTNSVHFALSNWYQNKYRRNSYINCFKKNSKTAILTNKHYYFIGGHLKNRNTMIEALIVNQQTLSKQAKHNIID